MTMRWVAAAAVALILLVAARPAAAEIRCSDAATKVLPCGGFLLSGAAAPSSACCGAVQSLDKMAAASGDRKAICRCFKGLSRSFPVNLDKAKLIPQLCHVTMHIAVTPNIDCDRI